MNVKAITFISAIALLAQPMFVLAAEDEPLSESLKKKQESIQKLKETSAKELDRAKRLDQKDRIALYKATDEVLEAKAACFKQGEEISIRVCLSKVVTDLAEKGNFYAQDELGIIYSNNEDDLALKWFDMVLKNPTTPKGYKLAVLESVEKIEQKVEKEGKKAKLSDSMSKKKEDYQKILKEYPARVRKAEILEHKEYLVILREMRDSTDKQSECYQNEDPVKFYNCFDETLKSCAEEGNFFCQHFLGNIYERDFNNLPLAIKWYEMTLKNPKLPPSYRQEVQNDLDRAKAAGKEPKQEQKK